MATEDSNNDRDFRSRLANIPPIERTPSGERWDEAAPPVVERQAPIARPAEGERNSVFDTPQYESEYEPSPDPGDGGFADPSIEEFDAPQKRRRRWPLALFTIFALLAFVVLVPLFLARRTFNSIERVPVSGVLSPPGVGTNILLVGTDSRAGIDADTENAGAIIGEDISGARTDTIMVLRIEPDGTKVLSLPRDLWLPINNGGPQRINTAFAQGPEALITTVQSALGVPISHYVQIDLAGFIDLVDAVGGVDITIPHPAFDRGSGLDLPTAGTVTLDSTQALAYVRSRRYTERRDGQEVVDGTSDLGRVKRQQEFIRALFSAVSAQRNPLTLNNMGSAIADSLIIDDATSLTEALEISNALRTSSPESIDLPTIPSNQGGASVLLLADGSEAALGQFRG